MPATGAALLCSLELNLAIERLFPPVVVCQRTSSMTMRNPSLMSFQSSMTSTLTVPTNVTTTSSSTIPGIGSLTGRALHTLGEATLRHGSTIVIQARLWTLKSQFPHDNNYTSPNLPVTYRDVLELSRYVSSFFI